MPSLGHSSSSGNTNKVLLHGACVPGKKSINQGAGQGVTEGRESCSYVGRDQPSLEASTTEVITEKVLRKMGVCPDSVLLGVLVGSGCYDKALQTGMGGGGLQYRHLFLTLLEAASPRLTCWQVRVLHSPPHGT